MNEKGESGQMLMMAALILVILMIAIPAVVFINHVSTRSLVANQKSQKAESTVQEGLAYAIHVLSATRWQWNQALNGAFPEEFTTNRQPTVYSASSGGVFTIQCSLNPTNPPLATYKLQPYEVQVVVRGGAIDPSTSKPAYNSGIQAVLGLKTLAVVLPSELQASLAIALMTTPTAAGTSGLSPAWGPVGVFNTGVWDTTGQGGMDALQCPRKFSNGDITGTLYPRSQGQTPQNTDGQEYWANTPLGFPNPIDTATYKAIARATLGVTPPVAVGAPLVTQNAYFTVGAGTAVFNGSGGGNGNPYKLNAPSVVYIDGNAEFDDIAIDLISSGAFIVNGNLTLNIPGNGQRFGEQGNPNTRRPPLNIPATANLEYPFYPNNPADWPCMSFWTPGVGGTCSANDVNFAARMHFRGFLYVTGNLILQNNTWNMAGAMRVDGTVNIPDPTGSRIYLFYDDLINHNILVTPVELMIDYQKSVSPS